MDPITSMIAGLMVIVILAVFLACVPVFIIISMMLSNHQNQMGEQFHAYQTVMAEQFQKNQEWTITAIATLSEHHSEIMQTVMLNLFGEMKRLSGKIPTVSVVPPTNRQTTGSLQKLPPPSPIRMTHESDEGIDAS